MNEVQKYINEGALILPKGCPVIVDEVDAAQSINITVINAIYEGSYICTYLSDRTNVKNGVTRHPTPLFLFGKGLVINENQTVSVVDTDYNKATYKDGEQRRWVGPGASFTFSHTRKSALNILRDYLRKQAELTA